MSTRAMSLSDEHAPDWYALSDDFSIVLGGPLYQLMVRGGLIRPPFEKLGSRIVVITLLAWLPLAVLALWTGHFARGPKIPFLYDAEVQTRLLFSLPLMILAEQAVYVRMRAVVQQFISRQLILQRSARAFEEVVVSAIRLRNSTAIEIALVLCVFLGGRMIWREASVLQTNTWLGTPGPSGTSHTAAGYWYLFVSLPVFQFILLRWYFRIFIWSRFLFQVSRLELNLVPLHPDRCCGLGFLGNIANAFTPLLMAHSALLAGFIANRILHYGAALSDFTVELVATALFLIVIVLGPLCVFVPKLSSAKFAGSGTYGPLASEYVIAFAEKWTKRPRGVREESLLGAPDIQSLADLQSSYSILQDVNLVPFGKQAFLRLLLLIALPLSPLLLTMFSPQELLKRLFSILL